LRSLAGYLLEVIAPGIAEQTEAAQLEAQEREARKTQFLRLRDDGDGCLTITGKLPPPTVTPCARWSTRSRSARRPRAAISWTEPAPSFEARRAQALITLVHAYSAGGDAPQHGGDRPRVVVLIDYDNLVRSVAGATLMGSNTRISPSEARRLACDSDILAVVLGSDSQILDVGRTTRLFTGDLRQAIAVRDRGYVFPGCDREPRDCDAHHIVPWTQNGPTSIDNAALVCPTHHRLIEPDPNADRATEHERWHLRMGLGGKPEVIPPSHRDQHRQPQRHKRFLVRQRR